MDHETAIRQNAAERYFLGELTGADRDQFEEHFFMCPDCAESVQDLTTFAANARAVLREPVAAPVPVWSRPAFRLSAALNVVLLLGLGYTQLMIAPELKREIAQARSPQFVQEVPILGVSRGNGSVHEIASTTQRIVFSFYLREPFRNISYELKNESGPVHLRGTLPAPPKEDTAESHFAISTVDLPPGVYDIMFLGVNTDGESPIGQSKFTIAGTR